MASPLGKKTSSPILRFVPEGIAFLEAYPTCNRLFKEKGWYDYYENLMGYHVVVARTFS